MPEVFPTIVLGWLMLVRSGLDSREQAAVMATTGGSLEVKTIRERLITIWEDDDLAERDGNTTIPGAHVARQRDGDRTWPGKDDE